jgi:tRNA-splicing ligase RtcB
MGMILLGIPQKPACASVPLNAFAITIWGTPDAGAVSQIKTRVKTADRVALMADHHKGYAVPVGGVVAYKNSIFPSGVGYDIACGNKAVLLDIPGASLRGDVKTIMDDVWNTISFGIGRRNAESIPPCLIVVRGNARPSRR